MQNIPKKAMSEEQLMILLLFIAIFLILVFILKDKLGAILGF